MDLPADAAAGDYAIRGIYAQDNDGNFQAIYEQEMADMGYKATANLINYNADNVAPEMTGFDLVSQYIDDSGNTHAVLEVDAKDAGTSGLASQFLVEFLSPEGESLQQWAYLDDQGHAKVDFSLPSSGAPGAYQVNTVRIADKAGNMNLHQDWLVEHPYVIKVPEVQVEVVGVTDTTKECVEFS